MTRGLDLTDSFDARCRSNRGWILRLRLENDDGVLFVGLNTVTGKDRG